MRSNAAVRASVSSRRERRCSGPAGEDTRRAGGCGAGGQLATGVRRSRLRAVTMAYAFCSSGDRRCSTPATRTSVSCVKSSIRYRSRVRAASERRTTSASSVTESAGCRAENRIPPEAPHDAFRSCSSRVVRRLWNGSTRSSRRSSGGPPAGLGPRDVVRASVLVWNWTRQVSRPRVISAGRGRYEQWGGGPDRHRATAPRQQRSSTRTATGALRGGWRDRVVVIRTDGAASRVGRVTAVLRSLLSPASLMGPPQRQCDGTTSGVVSVGVVMIAERRVWGQGRR